MCSWSRPAGVVASIPSANDTKSTPMAWRSSSSRIRWRRLRPRRSRRQTTSTSNRRRLASVTSRSNAGRRSLAADLDHGTAGDRYQVVVHVDADGLEGDAVVWQSALVDGIGVSAGTSRRIACDASRVVMTHARDGTVLDVGRKTRTVPPAIRRALTARDRRCRFPGCDAHHVRHCANGGATRLENLFLVCDVITGRARRGIHCRAAGCGEGSLLLA